MRNVTYKTRDGREVIALVPEPGTPRGYAAPPGTGPAEETCGSCKHYARRKFSKTYLKCGLMQRYWTGGPGTDIKARSPACSKWEAP